MNEALHGLPDAEACKQSEPVHSDIAWALIWIAPRSDGDTRAKYLKRRKCMG